MKIHNQYSNNDAVPGFASLLTVISIGIALLIVMISMYESTVESQRVQAKNTLKADYQQREDSFLRALVSILPNKAMIAMQNNSAEPVTSNTLQWSAIFEEALQMSDSEIAVDSAVAASLGINSMRNGNIANSSYTTSTIVSPITGTWDTNNQVTSGTNLTATSSFPPPLECTASQHQSDGLYPLVGYHKTYGASASGWVQDSVSDFPLYNRLPAPKLHFHYQDGDYLIAKHNWWVFDLSFASQDQLKTKITSRKKRYLLSLYEIPSQLPISASTSATFGTHIDGSEWSNINLTGGVFAEKVETQGSFSTDSIASRQGVTLSSGTTVNGNVTGGTSGVNPLAGEAREQFQSDGNVFPISSSSDGGRVAFVPINRGLEFYDHFAGSGDSPNSTNAVSPTSWDHYSLGAKQCRMRLTVTNVVSATDQTPTEIQFSYYSDDPADINPGGMVTDTFTKGSNWPDESDAGGGIFPFHVENSASGRPCISVYLGRLTTYLQLQNANYYEINNSISINADYINNSSIVKPPFPSAGGDMAVLLQDGKDLTMFTDGLSVVSNMRLIIADDLNITPTTTPLGVVLPSGEQYYPPLSLFSPEKRYGDSGIALKIDIEGQLGSLAKDNTAPVRIADLKSGVSEEVIPNNITATLRQMNHPAELPPINIMNWMVVIREIHP